MKKIQFLLLLLMTCYNVIGQVGTPTYFNVTPTTSTNAFPWNSTTSNKVQWIYGPNAFSTLGNGGGTLAPAGQAISKVYIRIQTVNATNVYSPDFAISLTQSGTSNVHSSGTYLTGLTTVFQSSAFQFTGIVAGSWYGFTCSTPFPYDPSLSLIIECKSNVGIAGGNSVNSITTSGLNQRIYGAYANPTGTAGTGLTPAGFDLISLAPCSAPPTAGTSVASPSILCAGSNINLSLTGNSMGTGQTYQWESSPNIAGPYTPVGVSGTSQNLITPSTSTLYYQCAVTCSGNTQYSTPVLVTVPGIIPGGTFTIDNNFPTAGTNFQTFADAIASIACGISGPVVFNVASGSGPYNEQVTIPSIFGASSTNTITFNGNGATLTSALGPSTLELNGADYFKFNNLTVTNSNASTAFACHLWNNADNNKFDGCIFTVPIANTATTTVPFSISGSQTSATTNGASGINDTVINCTISGGYYNTCFVGNSAAVGTGNYLEHNNLTEFYFYGSYNLYQTGMVIRNNDIDRPTRATVSSTYPIYLSTGMTGTLVEGNKIHNLFDSAPTSTSLCYGIYVIVDGTLGNENRIYNNMIYQNNHSGVYYPIFASGADYIKIYHNTIDVNHPTSTATGATYGIYSTGTIGGIDIKNNIVTLNRGGTGARYCLYFTNATTLSNNNVLFNSSASSATSGIGFFGSAQLTMANWQAVNAAAWDQQSVNVDPAYTAPNSPTYDFTPTSSSVNNIGAPVGVLTDITNNLRSIVTPDPGAIEFTLSAIDVAVVNITSPNTSGCYTASEPIVVTIQNAGFAPLDLSLNPVSFTGNVSGAATVTLSGLLNTGTVAPNATTTFTLTPNVDMTAIGSYTISITASLLGDGNPANDILTPAAVRTVGNNGGTLSTPVNTYCVNGTPSLTLTGASGGNRQWQESTVSATGPWTNIGSGGNSYTPSSALTQTTYFQVTTTCNSNTFTSNVLTITVNNPTVTSIIEDTICSNNTAILEATAPIGNVIKWFANSTGGSPLFTGSPFVTPTLTSTTTYYAEASSGGGGSDSVALPLASGTTTGVYHHMFRMDNTTSINLTGIGIKCNMAVNTLTSWDIYYRPDNYQSVAGANTSATGWTLLSSVTNVPSAGAADYTIISFGVNLAIPANSQYSFYIAPVGGSTHQYATSALGTTVASNADATLIAGNRGSSLFSCTTSGGMACVKMIYTTGCAGTRVPVVATVDPSPTVTATPSSATVCVGAPVTLTGGGTATSYTWSGGITDGVPFPASASTIYTVTGTSANGCTATATSSITTNPVLSGLISATPPSICLGGSSIIAASVTPLCQGNVNDFAGLYAPATWTFNNGGGTGTVNTAGAPANVIIGSGNNGGLGPVTAYYEHAVGCSGTVSFNWSTTASPNNLPLLSYPQYRINNGIWQNLNGYSMSSSSVAQSGMQTITVNSGDVLAIGASTLSGDAFDAFNVTISNFNAPSTPITGTVSIWDAPTGGNNLGTPPQTVTPSTAGITNYYAEFTTNGTGCVNLTRLPVPVTVNALPSVTATATPAAICLGASSVLTGGGASTYVWDVTNPDPYTVSPTSNTSYTVTGTDANGCSATSSVTVTVNPLPLITSLTATPDSICPNGTSNLAVLPGLAGGASYCNSNFTSVTYEFLTNVTFAGINNTSVGSIGGPVNYTAQTASVTAGIPSTLSVTMDPDANDYIYAWIDWNQNGTLNDAGEEYIVVSNSGFAGPHTLSITPPVTALNGNTRMRVMVDWNNAVPNPCRNATWGEAEDYTVNVTGGVAPPPSFASITWSPATFLNATNTASVTASAVTATTTYTVQGTDANGCSVTSSVTLTMTPAPTGNTFADPIVSTLPVSTTGNNLATNCWSSTYTGTNAQASPDVFYQFVMPSCNDSIVVSTCGSGWDTYLHLLDNTGTEIAFSDDDCAAASLINFTGLTPGATYYVVVEGFGSNTGTYNLAINSYQSSTLVVAGVSASPNPACENATVTLTGTGAGVGGSYTYTGPATITAGQFTATLAAAGTYQVTATTAAGCTATATTSVVVNALPAVTASVSASPICLGASTTFTGGGATSYTWTDGTNTPTDAVAFTPTTASVSTYTVTGTDANGCSNTSTVGLTVNPLPTVTASATPSTTCNNSTVTPMGGGASTYAWSGGLTDNTPFVATTGTTTYTVTGTDGIGCTATSTVSVTVNAASGMLASATSNQAQNQADDFNLSYYDPSCNLIATVDDGAGGNILGLTTAAVNVDANAGVHNGQPFVRRWYQITPSNNVGVSAIVTLYIDQADFTNYNNTVASPYLPMPTSGNNSDPNITNIRITKNSDAGLGNTPEVITPTTINWNGNYWELTFPVTGFSQFRVHSANPGNTPLPATITKFNGRKLNSSDMLEWTTASEQNNAYFNLQHSTNGVDFKTIAKVNSKAQNGNSQTELNYGYEHTTPSLGHNYYRLEQVDIDNQSTINAKIVDIIWGANGNTVSLYPNPTQDVLNIDLYTSKVQNTTVKVLDMSGRVVKQIQARSEAGMSTLSISLGELASGVYTVQVYENDKLSHVGKVKKN
jgi:hypothetical protein